MVLLVIVGLAFADIAILVAYSLNAHKAYPDAVLGFVSLQKCHVGVRKHSGTGLRCRWIPLVVLVGDHRLSVCSTNCIRH